MRKTLCVLVVVALGCQPDYGHLQPEYEQLLDVKDTLQVRKEEVRRNRKTIDTLQQQMEQLERMIKEYEDGLQTNINGYKRIVRMETEWNETAVKVVDREIRENRRLRQRQ